MYLEQLCLSKGVLCFCNYYYYYYYYYYLACMSVPVAARYKAWVYGRSLAGIAGSNPTGGIDVCLSVVCCQVEVCAPS